MGTVFPPIKRGAAVVGTALIRDIRPRIRDRETVGKGDIMTAAQIFDLTGKVALVTGASSGLGVRFAEVDRKSVV